jgi:hypothetical protein
MFLYASSALPGVVQQLTVCQSRAMAYVFPRAQFECAIYVFSNILVYSNGFLSWLVLFLYRLVRNILRGSSGICVFVDAFVCTW